MMLKECPLMIFANQKPVVSRNWYHPVIPRSRRDRIIVIVLILHPIIQGVVLNQPRHKCRCIRPERKNRVHFSAMSTADMSC